MKRKIILASLLVICGTNAMAAKVGEQGIGIEVGALKSNAVSRVNGVESDGDLSSTYEALRYGKYYDFGRVGASVGLMNEDKGTDGKFVALSYDYMFYNDSQIIPFIGAHIGYSWNEANYDIKHDGVLYGVEAGGVYEVSKEIDLEIGARYSKANIDGSKVISGTNVTVEVDNTMQYYVSIGYKF
jgi:hypothetical protein